MASNLSDTLAEYLDYFKIIQENREFLKSNKWHVHFTHFAAAAYAPSQNIIRSQCKSISGLQQPQPQVIEFDIRGFPGYQIGHTQVPQQIVTFEFADFEESTIFYYAISLRDAASDWRTQSTSRTVNLFSRCTIYRLDSEANIVRKYELSRMLLDSFSYSEPFDGTPVLVGDGVTLSFRCMVKLVIENSPVAV